MLPAPLTKRTRRYVSLYPATRKMGFGLWVVRQNKLLVATFGSVVIERTAPLLETYRPDAIFIEAYRAEADRFQADTIVLSDEWVVLRASPTWRKSFIRLPRPYQSHFGPLAVRASRLGWNELINRRGVRVPDKFWPPLYSESWLRKWSVHDYSPDY